ncbi:MAG: cobalamin B12-binding domain-containing protein [Thermotogota bacterium]
MDVKIKDSFYNMMNKLQREKVTTYIKEKLDNDEISYRDLYEQLLIPYLSNWDCDEDIQELCIFKEHVSTSIIRTIIEINYPFLVKQRKKLLNDGRISELRKKIFVACPSGEYHEIGARIVSDFFYMNGYEVLYVGANTPLDEIIKMTKVFIPDYIAFSVSDPYNIISAKKTISRLRENNTQSKIIVGGRAFKINPHVFKQIKADLLLNSFEDIEKLAEGDK